MRWQRLHKPCCNPGTHSGRKPKAAASDWLLNLFGLQPGGTNEVNLGHGRVGAFNIYNNVRTVGKGRAPGSPAARSAPNIIGTVPFVYPRMHDSISLPAELMHNLGRIDDPAQRDVAGQDMISRQTMTLAQKAANWRKAMLIGAMRDSLYLRTDGDSQYITYSSGGGAIQVNYQMPAGNKSQLNMLAAGNIIDASWATTTTRIPKHLMAINAAFQRLNGGHLAAVICGYTVWDYVLANDWVQEYHGTSNTPFLSFEVMDVELAPGRTMKNVLRAQLKSNPGVTFYVTDEGLDIGPEGSETFTKIVGDNNALFIGFEPGSDTISCYLGSEPIAEYDGAPEIVRYGLASWSVKRSNPTSTDLFVLDNSMIVNHVFDSVAYGTVVF